MTRAMILLALAVTLPGMATAAPPAAPKPASAPKPAAKPAPLPLAPGTRRITLSPEGNAIAQKLWNTADPRLPQIQAEMNALVEEQKKLIVGPKIDIDKLEPLLRRKEALQSEVRSRANDRMIALLRALSDPDRVALLQSLANPAQLQNSKPAAAPASR